MIFCTKVGNDIVRGVRTLYFGKNYKLLVIGDQASKMVVLDFWPKLLQRSLHGFKGHWAVTFEQYDCS